MLLAVHFGALSYLYGEYISYKTVVQGLCTADFQHKHTLQHAPFSFTRVYLPYLVILGDLATIGISYLFNDILNHLHIVPSGDQ